jgi:DNA-binding GntR family transcriptional regulator
MDILDKARLRMPRKISLNSADGRNRLGRAGLHHRVADHLRKLITRCELAPGFPVVEASLCQRLGVSRTPLREAMKLLAAEGLLELRPNRSPRVAPMDMAEIEQLFEVVSGLERIAGELAALRITRKEFAHLSALQTRMERCYAANDRDSYFEINQQIHAAIVSAAGNAVLKRTHALLLARAERARYFALRAQARWDESVAEHRAVLDAIEARDSARAGYLLGHHVARTGDVVTDMLKL